MSALETTLFVAVGLFVVGVVLDAVLIRSYRHYAKMLKRQNVELLGDRALLHVAVVNSEKVFRSYADLHAAKGTPEGRDKSARNIIMANTMAAALRLTGYNSNGAAND